MIADWPGRAHAEQQRQFPIIVRVAERVASMSEFEGLLVLGSFASGKADELSDLDLWAVVAEGQFPEAWTRREELHEAGLGLRVEDVAAARAELEAKGIELIAETWDSGSFISPPSVIPTATR